MSETPRTFDDAYPGRFLKAGQILDDKPTFTIKELWHEVLVGEKGEERKLLMSFTETDFQLVLCKLNGTAIKGMFGPNCPDWIGKRVTLFATDQLMPFPGKKGLDRYCMRVWGSPDIASDIMIEFKPARRKALTLHLHAIKKATTAAGDDLSDVVETIVRAFQECSSHAGHLAIKRRWAELAPKATPDQIAAVNKAGAASFARNPAPQNDDVPM